MRTYAFGERDVEGDAWQVRIMFWRGRAIPSGSESRTAGVIPFETIALMEAEIESEEEVEAEEMAV
jgi:hypothetical protein